jgi:hypothetical protein
MSPDITRINGSAVSRSALLTGAAPSSIHLLRGVRTTVRTQEDKTMPMLDAYIPEGAVPPEAEDTLLARLTGLC